MCQNPEICGEPSTSETIECSEPKRVRSRKFKISPVLKTDVCSEEVPLLEYLVLCVTTPSVIGKVLSLLPLMPPGSNHLKRIKDGRILIQPSSVPLPNDFIAKISGEVGVEVTVTTILVPKEKPVTKRQFLWAKQRWPTSFHLNKEIEALLDGSFFDAAEFGNLINFFLEAEEIGNGGSGCVIVDLNGKVVAKSGERHVTLGHAVMCAVSDLCESHRIGNSDALQYLGTGFDVFLTDEPCSMCAMALVHFRVGRVFFGRVTLNGGALVSCWRIQEERRLNHQYKVFKIDENS